MEYNLKKSILFFVLIVLLPISITIYAAVLIGLEIRQMQTNHLIVFGIVFLLAVCFIYFFCIKSYYDCYYLIQGNSFIAKMGLSKKKLNIQSIKSISKDTYPTAGIRPALSFKGITIKYGEGYSIFIAPENETEFISEMRIINPNIKLFYF